MAKFPKSPKGATSWEPEDRTPAVLREAESSRRSKASRGVYDYAELSEQRARYWLALDGWMARESALLLCAIDPGAVELIEARPGGVARINSLDWPLHFDDLLRMVLRAYESGALATPASPDDVLAWADCKNLRMPASFISHRSSGSFTGATREKPVSREAANRSAILAQLVNDGYDPRALPKPARGTQSVPKQRAKEALLKAVPPVSAEAFRKAWQALRSAGEISDT